MSASGAVPAGSDSEGQPLHLAVDSEEKEKASEGAPENETASGAPPSHQSELLPTGPTAAARARGAYAKRVTAVCGKWRKSDRHMRPPLDPAYLEMKGVLCKWRKSSRRICRKSHRFMWQVPDSAEYNEETQLLRR